MPDFTPGGIPFPLVDDKIKDGTSPSALVEDLKTLALGADAHAHSTADTAKTDAIADATMKYGGLPAMVTAIEARELPDRGRATLALYPGGIDSITASGKYAIWTAGDATALGLPVGVAGSVEVYAFGSVVEQTQLQHGSTGVNLIGRRRAGGVWGAWKNPGVDDLGIAALVKPGTQTYNAINAMIPTPEPSASTTKIAAVALSTGDGGGIDTATSRSFRYPIKIAANVKRFRVHVQNANPRYGNKYAGALSFAGLGIARHAGEFDPTKEGQTTGALTSIATAFTTNASGWEYVSPWVENSPISGYAEYLLLGGYTCATQNNFAGVAGGWVTTNANDWNVAAPAGMAISQKLPLYVWLEMEVDSTVRVGAWLGDSLASGVSARLGLFDSVANRHALAHGYIPTAYTNSGTKMGDHADPAHFKWTRYDTAIGLAKPDMLFWQIGSNDVFEPGTTVESVQARFDTCWAIAASKLSSNIALMTILPRHDAESPQELVRKAWNERLLTTLPGRASAAVDSAALLTNPDGSTLNQKYSATPSDIHLKAAGYVRFMQGLPPMHR